MIISEADEYIKFALGENVKRSRATSSTRFPDTRMGVEQVFVNAFNEAKIYESKWKNYNALSKKEKDNAIVPRKDIELDALTKILNGKISLSEIILVFFAKIFLNKISLAFKYVFILL